MGCPFCRKGLDSTITQLGLWQAPSLLLKNPHLLKPRSFPNPHLLLNMTFNACMILSRTGIPFYIKISPLWTLAHLYLLLLVNVYQDLFLDNTCAGIVLRLQCPVHGNFRLVLMSKSVPWSWLEDVIGLGLLPKSYCCTSCLEGQQKVSGANGSWRKYWVWYSWLPKVFLLTGSYFDLLNYICFRIVRYGSKSTCKRNVVIL
jgi:hypothetical protein